MVLLKKTEEFGEQAVLLEKEYEKLFEDNDDDNIVVLETGERKKTETVEKCGVRIPKLDFT